MSGVEGLLALSELGTCLHAVYVSITLGLPLAIMAVLVAYARTGSPVFMKAARTMTYVLVVNFALGAVTGTLA